MITASSPRRCLTMCVHSEASGKASKKVATRLFTPEAAFS